MKLLGISTVASLVLTALSVSVKVTEFSPHVRVLQCLDMNELADGLLYAVHGGVLQLYGPKGADEESVKRLEEGFVFCMDHYAAGRDISLILGPKDVSSDALPVDRDLLLGKKQLVVK